MTTFANSASTFSDRAFQSERSSAMVPRYWSRTYLASFRLFSAVRHWAAAISPAASRKTLRTKSDRAGNESATSRVGDSVGLTPDSGSPAAVVPSLEAKAGVALRELASSVAPRSGPFGLFLHAAIIGTMTTMSGMEPNRPGRCISSPEHRSSMRHAQDARVEGCRRSISLVIHAASHAGLVRRRIANLVRRLSQTVRLMIGHMLWRVINPAA